MRIFLNTLVIAFCLVSFNLNAQTSGNDIRSKVMDLVPDIDIENKILFVNVWKSSDFESRQNSKEFNRVARIYNEAKLKKAPKGVCFLNISEDTNTSMWNISLQKDSINCAYNFENSTGKFTPLLQLMDNKTGSIVINPAGEILARDLKKEDCFTLFRSQITR